LVVVQVRLAAAEIPPTIRCLPTRRERLFVAVDVRLLADRAGDVENALAVEAAS